MCRRKRAGRVGYRSSLRRRSSRLGWLFRGDPALADRVAAEEHLRAEVDADRAVLAAAALDVRLDRLLGGAHVGGDLLDRASRGVEDERALLLLAEVRLHVALEVVERLAHRVARLGAAVRRSVQGRNEGVRGLRLADERGGTRLDRAVDGAGVGVPGDDDRLAARRGED